MKQTYIVQWCFGPRDAGEAQFRTVAEAQRFIEQRGLDVEIWERRWSKLNGFYLAPVR